MIKLKSLITEAKITSDVERAAKKLGIKFDKKTKVVTTNKYSNPSGDMKRFGKDHEKVKMNQWMDDNPKDMKNQTQELVKKLKSKYKLVKHNKYASGESFKFINNGLSFSNFKLICSNKFKSLNLIRCCIKNL